MTMKFCIHGNQEATCPYCAKNSNPLYKCPDCRWQGTRQEASIAGISFGGLRCPNYSKASHLKPLIEMERVFPISIHKTICPNHKKQVEISAKEGSVILLSCGCCYQLHDAYGMLLLSKVEASDL